MSVMRQADTLVFQVAFLVNTLYHLNNPSNRPSQNNKKPGIIRSGGASGSRNIVPPTDVPSIGLQSGAVIAAVSQQAISMAIHVFNMAFLICPRVSRSASSQPSGLTFRFLINSVKSFSKKGKYIVAVKIAFIVWIAVQTISPIFTTSPA